MEKISVFELLVILSVVLAALGFVLLLLFFQKKMARWWTHSYFIDYVDMKIEVTAPGSFKRLRGIKDLPPWAREFMETLAVRVPVDLRRLLELKVTGYANGYYNIEAEAKRYVEVIDEGSSLAWRILVFEMPQTEALASRTLPYSFILMEYVLDPSEYGRGDSFSRFISCLRRDSQIEVNPE